MISINIFDDIVFDDLGIWSQLCSECSKHFIENHFVEEVSINGLICGVKNCNNEALYYIDF